MELLRYILGSIIALFGLYVIAENYVRLLMNYRWQRKGIDRWSSPVPLLGPCAAIAGSLILPLNFGWWVLLAFLADPDTVITLVSLPALARQMRNEHSDHGPE